MARISEKDRCSVTLSHDVVARLKEEAANEECSLSAVLARIVDEYCYSTAHADCEERLKVLQHKYTAAEERADTEVKSLKWQMQQEREKVAQTTALQETKIKELQIELEKAETRLKTLEQDVVNKDDTIQGLEQGVQALLTQAEQERASKETVTTGLRHEREFAQARIKVLEEQVVDLKGQVLKESDDKQHLYKQLELVTLRLPAPREGILTRVFGRKKKEDY